MSMTADLALDFRSMDGVFITGFQTLVEFFEGLASVSIQLVGAVTRSVWGGDGGENGGPVAHASPPSLPLEGEGPIGGFR